MAHADHGQPAAQAPYAAIQNRDIKALSEEEVESLRAGEGMGFALAAELNGYPGPKHALELADSLGLTDDQRVRIQAVMDRMSQQARELGRSIVAEERALDAAFADRSIRSDRMLEQAARIGEMRGRLRAIHLAAHLETSRLLTHPQHEQYKALRGYDTHAR